MLRIDLRDEPGIIREYNPNIVGKEIREGSILNFVIISYKTNVKGLIGYIWDNMSRKNLYGDYYTEGIQKEISNNLYNRKSFR